MDEVICAALKMGADKMALAISNFCINECRLKEGHYKWIRRAMVVRAQPLGLGWFIKLENNGTELCSEDLDVQKCQTKCNHTVNSLKILKYKCNHKPIPDTKIQARF